jgi:hypothetical protein
MPFSGQTSSHVGGEAENALIRGDKNDNAINASVSSNAWHTAGDPYASNFGC